MPPNNMMEADELRRIGKALHGGQYWHEPFAAELGISVRALRSYLYGTRGIPGAVAVLARKIEIERMMQ